MTGNKVQFGLKKLYYATITDSGTALTYGTPIALPGAVSMTATPTGEPEEFEADDIVYYRADGAKGYDMSVELAYLPESFYQEVLGIASDTNKVQIENNADAIKPIALLGQFNGDVHARLWAFYNCTPERPEFSGATSRSKTPKTITINMSSSPDPYTGNVKAVTTETTPSTVTNDWYTGVYTGAAE